MEATPKTNNILKIFEPMTFPKARSVLPRTALRIETTSSGEEEPKATTVRPITNGLILNLVEMEDAPSTSQSAPLIRMPNPITNNMREKNI